jgi:hypothetical protein
MIEAKVIRILDEYTVVINKGSSDGLTAGMRFLIYEIDPEELIDPDTKENLGKLEIVKGIGKILHIQDKIATLQSDKFTTSQRIRKPIQSLKTFMGEVESFDTDMEPFKDIKNGDLVKRIN